MYKKQIKCQKILCIVAVVACALTFLYALGLMTDLYDALYSTMRNPYDLTETDVPGSILYYDMQDFNKSLLKYAIGLVLLSCLLFLTQTHARRKYYVGNYCSVGLFSVAAVAYTVWAHRSIESYKTAFLTQVDFAALKKHAKMWKTAYVDSTFWFDAHYVVYAILLAVTALLLVNLIWKIRLMKAEQRLIEAGREAMA